MKSQWEHRDGDTVRGAYSMLEADGSMRIVEYRSDKDLGFRAIVKKIPNYLDVRRRSPSKYSPTTSPPPRIYRPSSSEAAVRPRDKAQNRYTTSAKNLPDEFEYTARTSSDAADPSRKYVSEIKGSRFTQNYEQEEKHHEQYDNGGQNILPILISTK